MKERLETAINGIRAYKRIETLDEKSIRAEVIDHILDRLGWDKFGEDLMTEYRVEGGVVDYALLVDNKPKVFIEAKRPSEDLISHQDQLLNYCAKDRVPLAVLTNGIHWWFYLRLQDGNAEDQPFCKLRIHKGMSKRLISHTCDCLIGFLSREKICSGQAVSDAEDVFAQLQNDKRIEEALPRAWKELKDGPDDRLIKLFDDKVEELCGLRAGTNRVEEFISRLGKGGAAQKPADPLYPRRVASQQKAREERMAIFKPIVFTMSPNRRCSDCADMMEASENDSTSTCKSYAEYPDAESAGRLSGHGPVHFPSVPPSPLPLVQGARDTREAATMIEFDIKGRRGVILGKLGSGKTVLARHIAGLFDPDRLAIWDPMKQFREGPGVYVPLNALDNTEFNQWLASTLPSDGIRSSRLDAVIIDHANLCFPHNKTEMRKYSEIDKLVNLNQHFGVTFIAIGNRPASFTPDVLEMASDIIVFKLWGPNDVRKLNGFADGMGQDAAALPDYHFLLYSDGDYKRCLPIDMSELKG